MKHLGPSGVKFLTILYNLSVRTSQIPACWKDAIILPLVKPGKSADDATGYRPISLLSPVVKVLERCLLPTITASLPPSPIQHGFRSQHLTVTALLPIVNCAVNNINQNKLHRSAAVAVDISKAFDTVDHWLLIKKILNTNLNVNAKRWLATYLRGRTASVLYQGVSSKKLYVRAGVPQGSILSPSLFAFFTADLPTDAEVSTAYADDVTVMDSGRKVEDLVPRLQTSVNNMSTWSRDNNLALARSKSNIILFTSDTHESDKHPEIWLGGEIIPLAKELKILGVTFDTFMSFEAHIASMVVKASSRLQIMKMLAGTSWGQQRESLLSFFKCIIKPLFTYAAPIWFPNTSKSSIGRLQVVQNAALRIALGCHLMTSMDHLHIESKTLPVLESLSMLCAQFYVKTLMPTHPSFGVVSAPQGPRDIKLTLKSRFHPFTSQYLVDDIMPPERYKQTIKDIHTTVVAFTVDSYRGNPVLLANAPEVNSSELRLHRHIRSTLSQLRSGWCRHLNNYRHRLRIADTDQCPLCNAATHTVEHLFNCSAFPTSLCALSPPPDSY